MDWAGWLTLAVLLAVFAGLARDLMPPPVVVLGGVVALLVAGVLTVEEAFSGFANPAPITVAALYVVAAAVEATGALDRVADRILGVGRTGGTKASLLRLGAASSGMSAMLNNTPIVAILAPRVIAWARRSGRSPSQFLMPLSFATILGGLVTAIGTSTNLVVSGLMVADGQAPMGLFEIARVGLPLAGLGVVVLALTTARLLPERHGATERGGSEVSREFTVAMQIPTRSALGGKTVAAAGLRNLEGVYLVEIVRAGRHIAPVGPEERLAAGDRLSFAGDVEHVCDLQRMPGLEAVAREHVESNGNGSGPRYYEAVVASGSSLVGHTLKEVGFRDRYRAAVLAIHRAGERLASKPGAVVLRAGDVLLLLADRSFDQRWREHHDFLLVAPVGKPPPPRRERAGVVLCVVGVLLFAVMTGLIDILQGALLAGMGLIMFRVVTPREARQAVDLNVIVLIAASFGLGTAMASTGLARLAAAVLADAFVWLGPIGLLLGVLLATSIITELITNNAAAVLMFPVAMATAAEAGLSPRPFAFAVAVGASAAFLSPIGYQTNTMVYGLGGYRFSDFIRLGAPLSVLVYIIAIVTIPLGWPLQ
jgi:di/tricarboxylate transporter